MPEFIVTDPSGKEHIVTAPDGATQDQALTYAKSQFAAPQANAVVAASPESKIREGMLGGAEAIASLGSGAVAAPIAGLAGVASMAIPGVNSGDVVNKVQNALTYEPRTEMGRKGVEQVSAPFKWLADKADQAGGAVSEATGSPMLGAGVNTAIQAVPMILGKVISKAGGSEAAIAARAKAQKLGAPVQAGLDAADEAGLAVTPTEAGAGVGGRTVEGLVGSPRLQKLTSQKNAPVINEIIRKDVGLPDDVPLTRKSLAEIRETEGKNYEAVKQIGQVNTDAQYAADLANITRSYDTAATDFAHRSVNPFAEVMKGLSKNSFDATSAVEEVKLLRADAKEAYANKKTALGEAYRSAAKALDDQLARQVVRSNLPPDTVSKYLASRKIIAKTYAADDALNEATGNINAAKYAQMLKNKKPLDQGALQVAKFGQQFPKSTQVAERIGPTGPTMHDLILSGVGQLAFGGAGYAAAGPVGLAAAAMGLARPVGRSVLASRPYQMLQRSMNRPTGKQGLSRHAGRAGTLASLAEQHGTDNTRR